MSACSECSRRTAPWNGSKPQCAFESGIFSPDNWNCATMSRLRELVYEGQLQMPAGVDYQYCEDQKYATVKIDGVLDENEQPLGLALWVSWYKSRGATEALWLLDSEGTPRRPTETEVLAVLKHYGR